MEGEKTPTFCQIFLEIVIYLLRLKLPQVHVYASHNDLHVIFDGLPELSLICRCFFSKLVEHAFKSRQLMWQQQRGEPLITA